MVLSNEAGTLIDNDIFIKNLAKNIPQKNESVGGMKWIAINTASDQYNEGKWNNGMSSADKIRFLSVKKYTPQQSLAIYNTLAKDDDTYGSAANNIYFSPEGHLGLNLAPDASNARENGDNPTWIPNKLATQNSSLAWIKANFTSDLTLGSQPDITNFLFRDKKICMFSPNLHWIVYYHPTESTEKPDGTPIQPQYYLLYNPLYRSGFKAIYRALVKADPNYRGTTGSGTALSSHVTATGYPARFNSNTTYTDIVNKYCNAFIIPKGRMPGGTTDLKHYGDPMCNIIMDSLRNGNSKVIGDLADKKFNEGTHGRFATTLRMNITQGSLLKDYYNGPAGKDDRFLKLYTAQKNAGEFYVCGNDGKSMNSQSFGGYASKFGHITVSSSGTTSFLQDFFNLRKNPHMMTGVGDPPLPRDTNNGYWGSTDSDAALGCAAIDQNITLCSMNFTAGGDINIKDANLENTCGGGGGPGDTKASIDAAMESTDAMEASTGNSTKTDAEVAAEVSKGASSIIIKKNATNVPKGPKAYDPSSEIQQNEEETQAAILAAQAESAAAAAAAAAKLVPKESEGSTSDKNKMYIIIAAIVAILILLLAVYFLLF